MNPREKEYEFCPTCKAELARKTIDDISRLVCPNCSFIFWNNPKPVASMLLENEGKVLLIKRSNEPLKDYWCLPGGYVNYGEEPTDAAIREAKEETDLDVKIEGLAGVYMIDNDPRGINIDIIYLGKILGGNLKLNEEASEANYFDPDNLPNLIAYRHREAIEDGFPPSRE